MSFYDIIINSIEKTSGPTEEYFLQSKKTLNAERSNLNIFFYLFVKHLIQLKIKFDEDYKRRFSITVFSFHFIRASFMFLSKVVFAEKRMFVHSQQKPWSWTFSWVFPPFSLFLRYMKPNIFKNVFLNFFLEFGLKVYLTANTLVTPYVTITGKRVMI